MEGSMKISEAPLMQTLLCKRSNTEWSEIFELTKLAHSAASRAVYVRVIFGMPGQAPVCLHYWRDVEDLDRKWEIFDVV